MTLDAPEPPGAAGAGQNDAHAVDGAPIDRLASLLSVDIGEMPVTRRRRRPGGAEPTIPPEPPAAPEGAEPPGDDAVTLRATKPADVGAPARARGFLAGAVLVVLLVAGIGLAYAGSLIIRDSTGGRVVAPIDDPTAPGFEAVVEATPTMVVLHDLDGALDAITVLTLPDPDGTGGGVLLVPTRTIHDMPLYEVNPVELAYDLGSPEFATDVVGQLLGTGIGSSAVVDAQRWAELVAPVAPITVDNTDALEVDGEPRFGVGEIELEAEDVGPYLEARVAGESDLARLFRHRTFWGAWLDAVADAGTPDAVPGEVDTGIGRFVRTIAGGQRVVETIPVQPATPGRYGDEPAFVPEFLEVRELIDRLVPLPVAASPGARARVLVVNGTSDTARAARVAPLLPPAGVQITLIGNAAAFGVETTTISFAGDVYRDEAEKIRGILGVGEVVEEPRPSDVVDITVTLGADYG